MASHELPSNTDGDTFRPPEARHPFDDLDADIILRSSDGVSFRVYRKVLAKASPVFRDMFLLPGSQHAPAHEIRDVLDSGSSAPDTVVPMVPLTERTQTLENLLRMCYPVDQPDFTVLEDVHAVLEATRKYMMDALVPRMKRHLMAFSKDEPLRVFLIAYAFGFKEEARQAAKSLLHFQMRPLPPRPPELHLIPSSILYTLLEYHDNCIDAAQRVLRGLSWVLTEIPGRGLSEEDHWGTRIIQSPRLWTWFRCTECPTHPEPVDVHMGGLEQRFIAKSWWMEYIRGIEDAVQRRPVGSLALDLKMMAPALRNAGKCNICGPNAFEELCEFSKCLAERIDSAVAAVPLVM